MTVLWGTLATGGIRLRKLHGYQAMDTAVRRAAYGTGEPDRITRDYFYSLRDTTVDPLPPLTQILSLLARFRSSKSPREREYAHKTKQLTRTGPTIRMPPSAGRVVT